MQNEETNEKKKKPEGEPALLAILERVAGVLERVEQRLGAEKKPAPEVIGDEKIGEAMRKASHGDAKPQPAPPSSPLTEARGALPVPVGEEERQRTPPSEHVDGREPPLDLSRKYLRAGD